MKWLVGGIAAILVGGIATWMTCRSTELRVRRISAPDATLEAAIRRARRELPEFERALRNPQPGQRFALRGRFQTESGPEYLWVRDPSPTDLGFRGALDQPPMALTGVRKGDLVDVETADVVDWLILSPGDLRRGGYTEAALTRPQ
jgi:uncharacterized protein YegJ (DUF2314 family)